MESEVALSVVIPLYNEASGLRSLFDRLDHLRTLTTERIEFVFVNDGSSDSTKDELNNYVLITQQSKAIHLSRNFGHQVAVTAGLSHCSGTRAILVIDGDLQDPPELLVGMHEKILEGYDVVYAIRKKRKENILKRIMYSLYYRILQSLAETKIPLDAGDFAMMSRRVVDIINAMPEESRFLRGMRAWTGFEQYGMEYERDVRIAGETKYTIKKLFKLAYDGIFNFSTAPIKIIRRLGVASIFISFVYFLTVIFKKVMYNTVPEGFTALLAAVILFSGVILFSIAVLGEYIVRIFFQVKGRPLFIIDEIVTSNASRSN